MSNWNQAFEINLIINKEILASHSFSQWDNLAFAYVKETILALTPKDPKDIIRVPNWSN